MKTIKEWLSDLPEPYKTKALGYITPIRGESYTMSLSEALLEGFLWEDTLEKDAFWGNVEDWSRGMAKLGEIRPYVYTPPHNSLSAIHAIALKKGFPAEEITGVWKDHVDSDTWLYTLQNNNTIHSINLSNQ